MINIGIFVSTLRATRLSIKAVVLTIWAPRLPSSGVDRFHVHLAPCAPGYPLSSLLTWSPTSLPAYSPTSGKEGKGEARCKTWLLLFLHPTRTSGVYSKGLVRPAWLLALFPWPPSRSDPHEHSACHQRSGLEGGGVDSLSVDDEVPATAAPPRHPGPA